MKLTEIAEEIGKYLRKFENDPNINVRNDYGITPYFLARAWSGKRYVYVKYISFQGASGLNKENALKYLEWLREGNIGTHYEAKIQSHGYIS